MRESETGRGLVASTATGEVVCSNSRPSPSKANVNAQARHVAKVVKTAFCRECRAKFEARRAVKEFCSASCRHTFHNRNSARGAEIIALAMHVRFDRKAAKEFGSFTLLSRLLRTFRDQDLRAGRGSWDDLAEVFERNQHLGRCEILDRNIAGLRRGRAARS